MRKLVLGVAATIALATLASWPVRAQTTTIPYKTTDIPYYRLNYKLYDDTYEGRDARARRFASFRWDGNLYCRYPSGWNGPGAYHLGDRFRTGRGWDGGYPWQGPGVVADHEDDEDFADAKLAYAREVRHDGECGPRYRRHHRPHRSAVLRRKD